jgi:hypothetical protein
MRRRRATRTVTRLLALSILAFGSVAKGASTPEVSNLRIGFSGVERGDRFKVGAWTPVWVQIEGGDDRFAGTVEVEVPDDNGTPTVVRQTIEVPARQGVQAVLYTRAGSRDPNFVIRLRNERGRRVGHEVDGSSVAKFEPVLPGETVVLALGRPSGVELLPALPMFAASANSGGAATISIVRIDVTAGARLPGRWYGYDAAGAVVLDTNDRDVMAALGSQGQALADWVARGGHLVLSVGANWQAVRDSALGPLLPGVPAGQERLVSLDLKSLDVFAGAAKSIHSDEAPPAMVTKLERLDERGGKVLSAASGLPLVVRGAYGFGRVTLVALDVDSKPFSTWPDRALFWARAADLRRTSGSTTASVRLGGGGVRLTQSNQMDLAGSLREALEQFGGVRLIPFGWVAFFIFLYILLIGPGDYLFLKKVVKRMELTWITFPLIVLTVSLGAYITAYVVKGKELRVNKLDVVDVDQEAGRARGFTYFNLFSPQNRDYDLTVEPLPLDRDTPASAKGGTAAAEAWSSAADLPRPAAGVEVLTTWLGVPGSGFGTMGGSARVGLAGGGYESSPTGTHEALMGVRIPIWSTKLLTARWTAPAPANLIESDLLPVGTDRLNGTVVNRTGATLHDAILAFNKHVYVLGDISNGESVRVELKSDRQLSGLLKSKQGTVKTDPSGQPRIERSALALGLMFHNSQGLTSGEQLMANDALGDIDLTGQLALDRPMLVGRLDRPAARLILGNAPAPPKVEQTTMLRVILPLSKVPEKK